MRRALTLAAALTVAGASWPSGEGTLEFVGTLEPRADMAVASYDLGGDVVARVGSYDEAHMLGPLEVHATAETLAYASDPVTFVGTSTGLVAVRTPSARAPILERALALSGDSK